MIKDAEIKKLANLAKLSLTTDEEKRLTDDLNKIIDYISELSQVGKLDEITEEEKLNKTAGLLLRADGHPDSSGKFSEGVLTAASARRDDYVQVKKIFQ